jgi:osmotically-inducible protein OsmY
VPVSRDKGILTLEGHVVREGDKTQAETLAKSLAGTQVVADQIAVLPPGLEKEAKAVNSDLDEGIEKNLEQKHVRGPTAPGHFHRETRAIRPYRRCRMS